MSVHEWLTTKEAALALRCNVATIRERVRDRSRADAFPTHLVDKTGHGIRIHRSLIYPAAQPTPIRATDLPYGGRASVDDRVETLLAALRKLQTEHLELATEVLRLKTENELLKLEREVA